MDEYAYILRQRRPQQHDYYTTSRTKSDHENETTGILDENENCGKLYAITDVKELHEWHVRACNAHPLFEPLLISESSSSNHQNKNNENDDDDDDTDPFIYAMKYLTEEGQKVDRNHGSKYYLIFECRSKGECNDDENKTTPVPKVHAGNFFQSSENE